MSNQVLNQMLNQQLINAWERFYRNPVERLRQIYDLGCPEAVSLTDRNAGQVAAHIASVFAKEPLTLACQFSDQELLETLQHLVEQNVAAGDSLTKILVRGQDILSVNFITVPGTDDAGWQPGPATQRLFEAMSRVDEIGQRAREADGCPVNPPREIEWLCAALHPSMAGFYLVDDDGNRSGSLTEASADTTASEASEQYDVLITHCNNHARKLAERMGSVTYASVPYTQISLTGSDSINYTVLRLNG